MSIDWHLYEMVWCIIVFLTIIAFAIHPVTVPIWRTKHKLTFDIGLVPIIGLVFLLIIQAIGVNELRGGFLGTEGGNVHPWAVVITFFSLAFIVVSMDETGIFSYIAIKAVEAAKGSGRRMFCYVFGLSSVMTVATSNDIVTLTFTPVLSTICNYAKVDAFPFTFAVQFLTSNIFSCMFVIGNATTIVVSAATGLTFVEHITWMALPTLCAGLANFGMAWLWFRKSIPERMEVPPMDAKSLLRDLPGAVFGMLVLLATFLLLSTTAQTGLQTWYITLAAAGIKLIYCICYDVYTRVRFASWRPEPAQVEMSTGDLADKEKSVAKPDSQQEAEQRSPISNFTVAALKRLPFKVAPFVLTMFIVVEGLASSGFVGYMANLSKGVTSPTAAVFLLAFVSALACNLLNNLPMTILFAKILLHPAFHVTPLELRGCMFGLIIGSNLGANITLIGALAGIMWNSILKAKGISVSYLRFFKHAILITPVPLFVISGVFAAELAIFG